MLPKSAGPSTRPVSTEWALNTTSIPSDLVLHIDASPLAYSLGYARGSSETTWLKQFETRQMANGQGYSVFEGAMFALFASGAGEPWPFDAPDVGFGSVREVFRTGWYHGELECGNTDEVALHGLVTRLSQDSMDRPPLPAMDRQGRLDVVLPDEQCD
ncbi:hypothetical protein HYQ46_008387 [Verticillium longisporum]|nr:hypothetical protein HYQ46_008387 [Verticillium longisporum]